MKKFLWQVVAASLVALVSLGSYGESLSIEETLDMAKKDPIVIERSEYPRSWLGNPEAREQLYADINQEQDIEMKVDMIYYVGFIGGTDDVRRLLDMTTEFHGRLNRQQEKELFGVITALAYLSLRGVDNATSQLRTMLTPEYWSAAPFDIEGGPYHPVVYVIWEILHRYLVAGDPNYPKVLADALDTLKEQYGKIPPRGDVQTVLNAWKDIGDHLHKALEMSRNNDWYDPFAAALEDKKCSLSLNCQGKPRNGGPKAENGMLSLDETLEMARMYNIRFPRIYYPRAWRGNADARDALFAAIGSETNSKAKCNMIAYIGYIGQAADVERLVGLLAGVSAEPDYARDNYVVAVMDALGILSRKGVDSARVELRKMLTPDFWSTQPFPGKRETYDPIVAGVWHALHAYALAGDPEFGNVVKNVSQELKEKHTKSLADGDIQKLLDYGLSVDKNLRKAFEASSDADWYDPSL